MLIYIYKQFGLPEKLCIVVMWNTIIDVKTKEVNVHFKKIKLFTEFQIYLIRLCCINI